MLMVLTRSTLLTHVHSAHVDDMKGIDGIYSEGDLTTLGAGLGIEVRFFSFTSVINIARSRSMQLNPQEFELYTHGLRYDN